MFFALNPVIALSFRCTQCPTPNVVQPDAELDFGEDEPLDSPTT